MDARQRADPDGRVRALESGLRSAHTRRATASRSTAARRGFLVSSCSRIRPSTSPDIRSTERRELSISRSTVGSVLSSVASPSSSRLAFSAVSGIRRSWLTRAAISRSRPSGTASASSRRSSRRRRILVTLSPSVASACSWTAPSSLTWLSKAQTRPTMLAVRRVDRRRGVEPERHLGAVDERADSLVRSSWLASLMTNAPGVSMECWHIVSSVRVRDRVDAGGDHVVELRLVAHPDRGISTSHMRLHQVDDPLQVALTCLRQ